MKNLVLLLFLGAFCAVALPAQTAASDAAAEKQRADRLQTMLYNYANFTRYRDANARLAPPAKGEDRVVFMGDSITDSWKLAEYFPNKPFVNRGVSGQTTSQMLVRFRPDVIDLKPKAVVILAGTNDLAGNLGPVTLASIKGNLASMIDLAHAHGIRVVMASVLPISDYNKDARGNQVVRTTRRPPAKILEMNEWIKKTCAERNLIYLDYFTATVNDNGFLKPDFANDGLHPNKAGYDVMKPLAEQAVSAALKLKQK